MHKLILVYKRFFVLYFFF